MKLLFAYFPITAKIVFAGVFILIWGASSLTDLKWYNLALLLVTAGMSLVALAVCHFFAFYSDWMALNQHASAKKELT